MNNSLKTIVLDIDGTLTPFGKTIPNKTVVDEILHNIEIKNVVIIATGRTLTMTNELLHCLDYPTCTILTNNGSMTLQFPQRKVLTYYPIKNDVVKTLVEIVYSHNVCGYVIKCKQTEIENGGWDNAIRVTDYVSMLNDSLGKTNNNCSMNDLYKEFDGFVHAIDKNKAKDYINHDTLSVLIFFDTYEEQQKFIGLIKHISNEIVFIKGGKRVYIILNTAISKGAVLSELEVGGKVIYIGDSENDIEGIEWAISRGGYGVAMGNSCKSVKDKANLITKNVEEDGVVYALNLINSY